jgi:iron complex transport system substrate-binding protein
MESVKRRPRVALLEWLQPFYVGGHWVPEMIERAGGQDVFGKARTPSFRVSVEEVIEAAPDVLLIAPCGYDKEQARDEYLSLQLPRDWNDIPAVRDGRVYAMDANSYVSRPSPRLVTGIEAMAKAIHPSVPVRPGAESAFLRVEEKQREARAAGG